MDAVTGAFSYSGAAIAAELARRGRPVRTLTNHPPQSRRRLPPHLADAEVHPLALDDPTSLRQSLQGIDTLYNTFWVRFPHGPVTFDWAVARSAALFNAAADAGVRRIVQVSITHADPASPYAYFRGKGRVEQHLAQSGVSHAIVRPAILFGGDGVLINNMAWLLRRFPVVAYGGDGRYRVRAIHIDDLATLMVDLGAAGASDNMTIDAVGPESLAFADLLAHLGRAVGSHAVRVPVPGAVFPVVTGALGLLLRDTLLTREEYLAMAAGLANSAAPTTGSTRLTSWINEHADQLGHQYAHEIRRHYRPGPSLAETSSAMNHHN